MKWLTKIILDLFYQRRSNTVYIAFHYKWNEMVMFSTSKDQNFEAPELEIIKDEIISNLNLNYWNNFIRSSKKSRDWGASRYAIDYEVTWDNKILINETKFREIKN